MCLAVPGLLVDRRDDDGTPMGTVDFGGTTKAVCLVCTPTVVIGDHVLVHAGFTIARIDEDAARTALALLADLEQSRLR